MAVISARPWPAWAGLGLTVLAATLLEIYSEGSTPIAADLLTRAGAPGNSFAFLMTGVSADYTEIMVLREATKSWRIALFPPLLTVPRAILISLVDEWCDALKSSSPSCPRQAGKTTLIRRHIARLNAGPRPAYPRLENPPNIEKLQDAVRTYHASKSVTCAINFGAASVCRKKL